MPSILENVRWGDAALTFLSKPVNSINPDRPAIIFLRHSEADYSKVEKKSDGILTHEGEEAAYEFGERLPNHYAYRIFHSAYPRARITAEKIHQGMESKNIQSIIGGPQPYLMFSESNERQVSAHWDRDGGQFLPNWLSGRYPPSDVESSIGLAKNIAYHVAQNHRDLTAGSIDLYLTHDIIICPTMFHWFGVFHPYRWTGLLDGFMLQLYEDKMRYYDKEGVHEVYYPHWWNL